MLHRVQPEAVTFGNVKGPHGSANLVILRVFGYRNTVGAVEGTPAAADVWLRRVRVVIRVVRLADEGWLGRGAAERVPIIAIDRTGLIGQVNQPAQRLILDVPLVAVILDVWPIAIEAAANGLQMKIFGDQRRIQVG